MHNIDIYKKAVGLVLTAFFAFSGTSAQNVTSMTVGNSNGRSVGLEPVSNTEAAGAAIHYPASTMQAFKGSKITQVKIVLQSATEQDGLTFFVARNLDDAPLYEEHFTAESAGTKVFDLKTPYTVDGGELFIGYTVKGVRMLSYSNAVTNDEEWILKNSKGWQRYDVSRGLCAAMTFTFSGDNLPQNNIRLTTTAMPDYSLTGKPVTFSGEFLNLGAANVKSLSLDYIVDGKKVATETVDGLDIEPRKKGSFTVEGLTLTSEGQPETSLQVSQVNGQSDDISTDNSSRTNRMIVRNSFQKRKTLLEVFSTEECPQCPAAHKAIEKVLGDKNDVVEVGHHAGFVPDWLTLPISQAYEWFYNPDVQIFAPAVMFDRTCLVDDYPDVFPDSVALVSPTESLLRSLYNVIGSAPAFVNISLKRTIDESTRHLRLDISGNQLLPIDTPDSTRLYVWLTEDSIATENQRGANGTFYHRHSIRQSLTETWGDIVNTENGFAKSYETDIPADWDISKMWAVAFVANLNRKDKKDCKVLNVEEINVDDGLPTGITEVGNGNATKQIEVFNLTGTKVGQFSDDGSALDSGLRRGVYIVRTTVGNKVSTRKITVK